MGTIEREPEVIDNLTSTSTIDALSAKQGKVLDDKITQNNMIYAERSISGNGGTASITVSPYSGMGFLIVARKNTSDTSGTTSLYYLGFTSDLNMGIGALFEGSNMKLEFSKSGNTVTITNRASAYAFVSVLKLY